MLNPGILEKKMFWSWCKQFKYGIICELSRDAGYFQGSWLSAIPTPADASIWDIFKIMHFFSSLFVVNALKFQQSS